MFTIQQVAHMLRAEIDWLIRFLRLTGISASYEETGMVGAETVRLLYRKLEPLH